MAEVKQRGLLVTSAPVELGVRCLLQVGDGLPPLFSIQ